MSDRRPDDRQARSAADRKLRVHLLDCMQNAPFALPAELERLPVELVGFLDADLIVGRKLSMFAGLTSQPHQRHLLWTHEPFFDRSAAWRVPDYFPAPALDRTLYVFNVHNGLIYTDNFYLAPRRGKVAPVREAADLNQPYSNKVISFAATYKLAPCIVAGEDLSLNRKRSELALALHARGRARIIGRDWPEQVAESESRFAERPRSKAAFLKQSNFNLCFENCVQDYYVTEKLWEAIHGGCLPIFWSNGTIYQTFPRGSFIDGRDFPDADSLIRFIDEMPLEDYVRRVNLCRALFNYVVEERYRQSSRDRSLRRLSAFLLTLRSQ